jgi:Bacterial Ig-like domain (group 3)
MLFGSFFLARRISREKGLMLTCLRRAFAVRKRKAVTYAFELIELEKRDLPSGFAPTCISCQQQSGISPAIGSPTPLAGSFGPAQITQGYGISGISFNGIVGDGTGQTIAIIDAFNNPNLVSSSAANFPNSDLHTFDLQYGLPEPTGFFTKVNQTGGTSFPGLDPTGIWEAEEALDVEWAHAIAPQAHIILVEANNNSSGLFAAINWARLQPAVSVISMSWGASEFSGEGSLDSYFQTPSGHQGITFIAAAGDYGAPGVYPAFSPKVLAVGGTNLTLNADSTYNSESGWSGSGGGTSLYETEPTWQQSVQTSGYRQVPDVAFDADPSTGVAVCDSYNNGATTPWASYGGTSVGAPCWSGLIAIANQGRAVNGFGALNGSTQTIPALYGVPAADVHDITTGSNGFAAGPGYDLVTGRGTPIASLLVPALAGSTSTALAASANPVVVGQSFSLTATVTGVSPTGTVTFMDGSSILGSLAVNSSGQATFVVTSLNAGNHALTALYGGDSNNAGSTASTVNETVSPAGTSVTLVSSLNPETLGQAVTFTATVSVTAPGMGTPTGTLVLEDGNMILGGATISGGVASFTTSGLSVGTHAIRAIYVGSSDFNGSTSAILNQVVNAPAVAPVVASVIVNGGVPAYTDANGLSFSLAGQYSVVEQILVTFSEAVTLAPGAFTITNNATGVTVISGPTPNTLAVNAVWGTPVAGSGNTQWIVTFSGPGTTPIPGGVGNVIKDGLYVLNVIAADVTAIVGGLPMVSNVNTGFWALFGSATPADSVISNTIGDGNSDASVGADDFLLFKNTFNTDSTDAYAPPYYNFPMDSNLDGSIAVDDFEHFKNNYNADWQF